MLIDSQFNTMEPVSQGQPANQQEFDYRIILDSADVILESNLEGNVIMGCPLLDCVAMTHLVDDKEIMSFEQLLNERAFTSFYEVNYLKSQMVVEQQIRQGNNGFIFQWRKLPESEISLVKKLTSQFKHEYLSGIGKVTHDFNNVLAVVMGHAELVNMIPDPEKKVLHLNQALKTLDKIRNLLKQILSYRHHLEDRVIDNYDLAESLRGSLAEFKECLRSDISVKAEIPDGMMVKQSRYRMKEVFNNLLYNAAESLEANGSVMVQASSDAGKHTIVITDDGVGMSNSVQRQAFEPFFSTHPRLDSAGVGLRTVKGILKKAGGTISIESELGQGTTVTITIPSA